MSILYKVFFVFRCFVLWRVLEFSSKVKEGTYSDTIVATITDNPDAVEFAIAAIGALPKAHHPAQQSYRVERSHTIRLRKLSAVECVLFALFACDSCSQFSVEQI